MMTPAKTLRVQARSGCEACSDYALTLSCACFLFLICVLGVRYNTTLLFMRLSCAGNGLHEIWMRGRRGTPRQRLVCGLCLAC